jgi:hypothetical protein
MYTVPELEARIINVHCAWIGGTNYKCILCLNWRYELYMYTVPELEARRQILKWRRDNLGSTPSYIIFFRNFNLILYNCTIVQYLKYFSIETKMKIMNAKTKHEWNDRGSKKWILNEQGKVGGVVLHGGGLMCLWLVDWKKKCIYFTYSPPWAPHNYDLIDLTSLTHSRKILLVVLQIRKAKDLSAPLPIYLALDWVQQRALASSVVRIRVSTRQQISWLSEKQVASHEEVCSVQIPLWRNVEQEPWNANFVVHCLLIRDTVKMYPPPDYTVSYPQNNTLRTQRRENLIPHEYSLQHFPIEHYTVNSFVGKN